MRGARKNVIHTWENQIVCGDAQTTLRELPSDSVDTVVTSPPYFRQRNYGEPHEIGGESKPDDYAARIQNVFREVLRVLKPSGSLWLVLGDKYLDGRQLGLPWSIAFRLQATGWILRSDIIWHKPNAMPCSVKSRPTVDHEYIFLMTKNKNYYYNADAIREPHVTFTPQSRMRGGRRHFHHRNGTPEQGKNGGNPNLHDGRWDQAFHPLGRNKRSVWSIPLSKYRGAHFAVFPERLVELCLLAGCPPGGLVLDPFLGSGTTVVVAQRLGHRFLGIDCVERFCQMARRRVVR
jgi:site-specific DNA-methyltransferase (adenine-specific)